MSTLLLVFVAVQLTDFGLTEVAAAQPPARPNNRSTTGSRCRPGPAAEASTCSATPSRGGSLWSLVVAGIAVGSCSPARSSGSGCGCSGSTPAPPAARGCRRVVYGGAALVVSGAARRTGRRRVAHRAASPATASPPASRSNLGWQGLLVALLARHRPPLAIPMAFVFAALRTGSGFLAATGVERRIADVVQAMLVLALLVPAGRAGRATAARPAANGRIVDRSAVIGCAVGRGLSAGPLYAQHDAASAVPARLRRGRVNGSPSRPARSTSRSRAMILTGAFGAALGSHLSGNVVVGLAVRRVRRPGRRRGAGQHAHRFDRQPVRRRPHAQRARRRPHGLPRRADRAGGAPGRRAARSRCSPRSRWSGEALFAQTLDRSTCSTRSIPVALVARVPHPLGSRGPLRGREPAGGRRVGHPRQPASPSGRLRLRPVRRVSAAYLTLGRRQLRRRRRVGAGFHRHRRGDLRGLDAAGHGHRRLRVRPVPRPRLVLQALGHPVNTQLLNALPYVMALATMLVLARRGRQPGALARPFARGLT